MSLQEEEHYVRGQLYIRWRELVMITSSHYSILMQIYCEGLWCEK